MGWEKWKKYKPLFSPHFRYFMKPSLVNNPYLLAFNHYYSFLRKRRQCADGVACAHVWERRNIVARHTYINGVADGAHSIVVLKRENGLGKAPADMFLSERHDARVGRTKCRSKFANEIFCHTAMTLQHVFQKTERQCCHYRILKCQCRRDVFFMGEKSTIAQKLPFVDGAHNLWSPRTGIFHNFHLSPNQINQTSRSLMLIINIVVFLKCLIEIFATISQISSPSHPHAWDILLAMSSLYIMFNGIAVLLSWK